MKIIPNKENTENLIRLWSDVFGDEREYVELLFPYGKAICDVFAAIDGDKIVSVLYLLDCALAFNGVHYNGKYIYAAATDKMYRGKGLMASLIIEAQEYCSDSGVDFISLVPAGEGLYNYYKKFGFASAMYRTTLYEKMNLLSEDITEISGEEYFREREARLQNSITFIGESVGYAVSCLEYSGLNFYRGTNGRLLITEADSCLADELINGNTAVRYVVSDEINGKECDVEKYGMLYPIHSALKRDWTFTDLYMNIALD